MGNGRDQRQGEIGLLPSMARRSVVDLDLAAELVGSLTAMSSEQQVLEAIISHGYEGVHPSEAALAVVGPTGLLHLVAGVSVPDAIRASFPMQVDDPRPLAQALADRAELWIESATDRDRWYPYLTKFSGLPPSGGFIPLDLASAPGGVLAVLFDHERRIGEAERTYYLLLANLCALALDRLALSTTPRTHV